MALLTSFLASTFPPPSMYSIAFCRSPLSAALMKVLLTFIVYKNLLNGNLFMIFDLMLSVKLQIQICLLVLSYKAMLSYSCTEVIDCKLINFKLPISEHYCYVKLQKVKFRKEVHCTYRLR